MQRAQQISHMRVEGQKAFVLRTQTYLESSLLADIYCREYGRLKLVVKGAKSSRSKTANQLQLFSPLVISWQGKSELKTLTSIDSGLPFLSKPDRLVAGMYLNELLFFLMTELDPHPEVYDLYAKTLINLEQSDLIEPALRYFEFGLLEDLGYGIDFSADTNGDAFQSESRYQYFPDLGFSAVDVHLKGAIPGDALIELREQGLATSAALRVAKVVCRANLDLLLSGRELQSRKWYTS